VTGATCRQIVGALILVVTTGAVRPRISSFTISGGNLIFSGINGTANGTYTVLSSTNAALPLSQWTPIATNTFSGTGTFGATNAVSGNRSFFTIEVP